MEGALPTSMSGSCGACVNGRLYVFGGYDDKGYSNRVILSPASGARPSHATQRKSFKKIPGGHPKFVVVRL